MESTNGVGDTGGSTHRGRQAVLFVAVALLIWFALASLAKVVIACSPPVGCEMADLRPGATEPRDVLVLVLSLLTALWVSFRVYFPPSND
jgi:hypothetical protein